MAILLGGWIPPIDYIESIVSLDVEGAALTLVAQDPDESDNYWPFDYTTDGKLATFHNVSGAHPRYVGIDGATQTELIATTGGFWAEPPSSTHIGEFHGTLTSYTILLRHLQPNDGPGFPTELFATTNGGTPVAILDPSDFDSTERYGSYDALEISPDGTLIAFAHDNFPESAFVTKTYVCAIDGSGLVEVAGADDPAFVGYAWKPDSSGFVYADGTDIKWVEADGSSVSTLYTHTAAIATPVWSPDGTMLAMRATGDSIITVSAAGSLIADTGSTYASPIFAGCAWSTDSTQVALIYTEGASTFQAVAVIDAATATEIATYDPPAEYYLETPKTFAPVGEDEVYDEPNPPSDGIVLSFTENVVDAAEWTRVDDPGGI